MSQNGKDPGDATFDDVPYDVPAVLRRGLALSTAFRRGAGVTVLLGLTSVAGRMAVPVAVQQAIDNATRGGGAAGVIWPVTLATVAVVATAGAAYAASVRLYRASETGLAAVRVQAFRHIHRLPLVRQETQRRGALVARVTSDVDAVSSFLQYKGLLLAVSTLQLATTTAVMAWYDWRLTLLVWLLQLPLIVFLQRGQPALARRFAWLQDRMANLLATTSEALMGAEAVRAYAAERYVAGRAEAAIDDVHGAQRRSQAATTRAQTVADFVPNLITVAVVLAGAWLVGGANLTVGDLTAFLFLAVLFAAPTRLGVTAFTEAQRALAGGRRLLGVLDAEPEPVTGTVLLDAAPGPIAFNLVGFAYPGGPQVLREVSVVLPAGQRVAVVGETGSGKTTFAKLACGLLQPATGEVTIGGLPLHRVDRASLRRRVAIVAQEGYLFDADIAANIRFAAPDADDDRIEEAFADLGLRSWLDTLPRRLHTPVGLRGASLSAGERQLVALVRAHAADPAILILDEATSAVDPSTEDRIQRALDRLTQGRTAVVIAHRLATARTADAVIVFDHGRVVEFGAPDDLLCRSGAFTALHDAWIARPRPAADRRK